MQPSYSETTSTLAAFSTYTAPDANGEVHSDYWNIDDILAEEELVPTVFKKSQNNLGFLTLTANQNKKTATASSIPESAKVDLPLWLATLMSTRGIVDLMRPLFMTTKFFN